MNNKNSNHIVVVLGSGRSGTSLLMRILESLGMSTSADMIPAKEQTPTGTYEDREIFQIQNELIGSITPHAMPMPADWEKNKNYAETKQKLKNIIADRIEKSSTLFGFKDPKTSMLLPMWTKIFNEMALIPKYILTVRDPKSVIASMKRQYNSNSIVSELFWLTRYTEALHNSGGNCFIIHHEDWFTGKGPDIAHQLLEFTGLADSVGKNNLTETLEKAVQPNLNRAIYDDYDVKNRYVLKLYNQLQQCHGDRFDRQSLMNTIMECRKAMDEFSGWAIEAQRFFSMCGTTKKKVTNNLKIDLQKSVIEANKYLQACKNLGDENENLRIKVSVQTKETIKNKQEIKKIKKDLNRKKKELFSVRTSTSFKVGQILVNAVAKPGKNTILFPFYLLRMILASRVANK